jgi:hypothetical protein
MVSYPDGTAQLQATASEQTSQPEVQYYQDSKTLKIV